ncbi:hypothetical protein GW742_25050 [Citrobacter freundii]|nr:hypothetical protein [Citrobacter freundii]MBC6509502.1 hypothetical protein [Citrobacter freundii]
MSLPAGATGTLWVGNPVIDKARISKISDSQNSGVSNDVIKNALGRSFVGAYIGHEGGVTYITFWLDKNSDAAKIENCIYSTGGTLEFDSSRCPATYSNEVSVKNTTGGSVPLQTQYYADLSLNGTTSNKVIKIDFPSPPPDEFREHIITWDLGPLNTGEGFTGAFSVNGDRYLESPQPWPSVTCARQATPITFSLSPDTLSFGDVSAGSSQVLTRPLDFAVITAPATLPAATLTFSHTDVENGKLNLGGGKVSLLSNADNREIRMNEPFPVTGKTMGFTVALDASTARPMGLVTANMLVTLTIN